MDKIDDISNIKYKEYHFKPEWSDYECRNISNLDNFPSEILDLEVQKYIIMMYYKFYLGRKLPPKGLKATDLIFAVLAMLPKNIHTEDTFWNVQEYGSGNLFTLPPIDIELVKTNRRDLKPENDTNIMKDDENIDDKNQKSMDLGSTAVSNEEKGKDKKQEKLAPSTKQDCVADQDLWPKYEDDPLNISSFVKVLGHKKTGNVLKLQPFQYIPTDNLEFIKLCDTLIAQWDTDKNARVFIKLLFSLTALTFMRAITKSHKHLENAFSGEKFRCDILTQLFSILKNIEDLYPSSEDYPFSPPSKKCISICFKAMREDNEKIKIMFAKVLIHVNNSSRNGLIGSDTEDLAKRMIKHTLMNYTSNFGLELVVMMRDIIRKTGRVDILDIKVIKKATYCDLTSDSWNKLLTYIDKYITPGIGGTTHYWARIINEKYFKELDCVNNYALAVIFAVFNENITNNEGIWESKWVKRGNLDKLEKFKYIGRNMFYRFKRKTDYDDAYALEDEEDREFLCNFLDIKIKTSLHYDSKTKETILKEEIIQNNNTVKDSIAKEILEHVGECNSMQDIQDLWQKYIVAIHRIYIKVREAAEDTSPRIRTLNSFPRRFLQSDFIHTEKKQTNEKLNQEFYIKDVKGDGNCFYRVLADLIFYDEEQYVDIKLFIINHVLHNIHLYEPLICRRNTTDIMYRNNNTITDPTPLDFLKMISFERMWANQTVSYAASTALNRNLITITIDPFTEEIIGILKYTVGTSDSQIPLTIINVNCVHYMSAHRISKTSPDFNVGPNERLSWENLPVNEIHMDSLFRYQRELYEEEKNQSQSPLENYPQEESSYNPCLEICSMDYFPIEILNIGVQKNVIKKFFNFYITGQNDELDVIDLVLAIISIMPLNVYSEATLWMQLEYQDDGTLFTLTPEDIELAEANVQKNYGSYSDEEKQENIICTTLDTNNLFNFGYNTLYNQKIPVKNELNVYDKEQDNKITEDLSKLFLEENIDTANDIVMEQEKKDGESSISSDHIMKKKSFKRFCNKLLNTWNTDAKGRTALKYFFGVAALTLMRGITESYEDILNEFSHDFRRHVKYIKTATNYQFYYLLPHQKCIKACQKSFKKMKKTTIIMFAKIVAFSASLDQQVECWNPNVPQNEPRAINIFDETLLKHVAYYGPELFIMMHEILNTLTEDSIHILFDATIDEDTAKSWNKLNMYTNKYQVDSEYNHFWARVLDKEFCDDLSCVNNYLLAVIFAVIIEGITEEKTVWQSAWVKEGDINNLEDYQDIGAIMFLKFQKLKRKSRRKLKSKKRKLSD